MSDIEDHIEGMAEFQLMDLFAELLADKPIDFTLDALGYAVASHIYHLVGGAPGDAMEIAADLNSEVVRCINVMFMADAEEAREREDEPVSCVPPGTVSH